MDALVEISDEYFASMVQEYADDDRVSIYELDKNQAVLKVRAGAGRVQPVYIIKNKTQVEFSVQSVAWYHVEENIPRVISTYLLQRNAKLRFGFWCIDEVEGEYCYSCMHNADVRIVDAEYFSRITDTIATECDIFDDKYDEIARKLGKIK